MWYSARRLGRVHMVDGETRLHLELREGSSERLLAAGDFDVDGIADEPTPLAIFPAADPAALLSPYATPYVVRIRRPRLRAPDAVVVKHVFFMRTAESSWGALKTLGKIKQQV